MRAVAVELGMHHREWGTVEAVKLRVEQFGWRIDEYDHGSVRLAFLLPRHPGSTGKVVTWHDFKLNDELPMLEDDHPDPDESGRCSACGKPLFRYGSVVVHEDPWIVCRGEQFVGPTSPGLVRTTVPRFTNGLMVYG